MNQINTKINIITNSGLSGLNDYPNLSAYGPDIKETIRNLVSSLQNASDKAYGKAFQIPAINKLYFYILCLYYYVNKLNPNSTLDIKSISEEFSEKQGFKLFFFLCVLNDCYISINHIHNIKNKFPEDQPRNLFIFRWVISTYIIKILKNVNTIIGPVNLSFLKNVSMNNRYNIYLFGDKHVKESSCPSESDNRYYVYNYILLTCLAYPNKKFEFYIEKDPEGTPDRNIKLFSDVYLSRIWKTFLGQIKNFYNLSIYDVDYRYTKLNENDYMSMFMHAILNPTMVPNFNGIDFNFFKDINKVKDFFHKKFLIQATKKDVVSSFFVDTITKVFDTELEKFYSTHLDLENILKNKNHPEREYLFVKISNMMDYYVILKMLTDKPIKMELEDSSQVEKNIFYYAGYAHTYNTLNILKLINFELINYSESLSPPNNMQCLSIKGFSKPFFSQDTFGIDLPKMFTATQKLVYFCAKYLNLNQTEIQKISNMTDDTYDFFYKKIKLTPANPSQIEEKFTGNNNLVSVIFNYIAYYIGILSKYNTINFDQDQLDIINNYPIPPQKEAEFIKKLIYNSIDLSKMQVAYLQNLATKKNIFILEEPNKSEDFKYLPNVDYIGIEEFVKILLFSNPIPIQNFYVEEKLEDKYNKIKKYPRVKTLVIKVPNFFNNLKPPLDVPEIIGELKKLNIEYNPSVPDNSLMVLSETMFEIVNYWLKSI